MKEIKPHEERYFKDIVLNNILNEIADEQGTPLDKTSSNTKSHTKKQTIWLSIVAVFFIVMSIFLILFTIEVTAPAKKPHQTDNQEPEETKNTRQQSPSKLIKQDHTNMHITISKKPAKTSTKEMEQNEQERAKIDLLEQMKK